MDGIRGGQIIRYMVVCASCLHSPGPGGKAHIEMASLLSNRDAVF